MTRRRTRPVTVEGKIAFTVDTPERNEEEAVIKKREEELAKLKKRIVDRHANFSPSKSEMSQVTTKSNSLKLITTFSVYKIVHPRMEEHLGTEQVG